MPVKVSVYSIREAHLDGSFTQRGKGSKGDLQEGHLPRMVRVSTHHARNGAHPIILRLVIAVIPRRSSGLSPAVAGRLPRLRLIVDAPSTADPLPRKRGEGRPFDDLCPPSTADPLPRASIMSSVHRQTSSPNSIMSFVHHQTSSPNSGKPSVHGGTTSPESSFSVHVIRPPRNHS
jgi:hypothetical protein